MSRARIFVRGVVQGVGFRPFVYNLARSLDIKGYVVNTSGGVIIEIEGNNSKTFIEELQNRCPPLARIDSIDVREHSFKGYVDFSIIQSLDLKDDENTALIPPDVSICDDCLKEMFDSSDRRYLYPFTVCTNCGPRYSITRSIPYDRPNTVMSVFNMCDKCLEEYNNPISRRFHAQPNSCNKCGPQLQLHIQNQRFKKSENIEPLRDLINTLKQGGLIAVKGIGGFHLCCDARNEEAVERLRINKKRGNKPFALMSPDIALIRQYCRVSAEDEKMLNDNRRPIVIMRKRDDAEGLSDGVAPNNAYLGFMLPYTPVHYLMFYYPFESRSSRLSPHFHALVMTSGNLSEEPIVSDNEEAVAKLSFADAFLLHNRDIFMRVDDSLVKASNMNGLDSESKKDFADIQFIRRGRGYTPDAIELLDEGPDVLACGADIKNTFTITKGCHAIVSQHIGDMENLETIRFFEESLNNLKQVYRAEPAAIAYDAHPDYLSSKWALNYGSRYAVQGYGIQHHYAHIASVMAEKGIKGRVIGVAFDGTGYGEDGNLWGSEFFVCDLKGFARAAHFRYIPLPGGEMAIKECWRTAVSYLKDALQRMERLAEMRSILDSIGFIQRYGAETINNIINLAGNNNLSPLSCGAGRLFDAVAAITSVCDYNSFEGEAAISLESALQGSMVNICD